MKQAETSVVGTPHDAGANDAPGGRTNFQRKISSIDAPGLALDRHGDARGRNAAGGRLVDLVVCTSLIDKVPRSLPGSRGP